MDMIFILGYASYLVCRKCLTTWGILFFSLTVQIYFYCIENARPCVLNFSGYDGFRSSVR